MTTVVAATPTLVPGLLLRPVRWPEEAHRIADINNTSRLADGLVRRQLIERSQDAEDRRQRTLALTGRGQALLGLVDRARAQEFLSIVRPLPTPERAVVAMGVAALSTHAMTRRGHLIKQRAPR